MRATHNYYVHMLIIAGIKLTGFKMHNTCIYLKAEESIYLVMSYQLFTLNSTAAAL